VSELRRDGIEGQTSPCVNAAPPARQRTFWEPLFLIPIGILAIAVEDLQGHDEGT